MEKRRGGEEEKWKEKTKRERGEAERGSSMFYVLCFIKDKKRLRVRYACASMIG